MKNIIKTTALVLVTAMVALGLNSCEQDPNKYIVAKGHPVIKYIITSEASAADSLITSASTEALICVVGENLRSTKALYFNDLSAILNPSMITDNTLLVQVPASIPGVVSNKMYFCAQDGDTVKYDFEVIVPGPQINSAMCEYVPVGQNGVLNGNYFVDDPNVPLEVVMPDGQLADVVSYTQSQLTFKVPEGCTQPGKIVVKTIYGSCESNFYFNDDRGIITDFEGDAVGDHFKSSKSGITPQGWNLTPNYSSEGGCSGRYYILGDGSTQLKPNEWIEAPFQLPFWAGNWNGNPRSIPGNEVGTTIRNAFPEGYLADWKNMSVKFELNIPASNPWKTNAIQLFFANSDLCANDAQQNNTCIKPASIDGGPDLCRGLYAPWKATGSFDTNGEWITAIVPLSEFTYNADGTPGKVELTEESFESFWFWPWLGWAGEACAPIFKVDNIRIVPN